MNDTDSSNPPSSAKPASIPAEIPGIAVAEGLARFRHDETMFFQLLWRFRASYVDRFEGEFRALFAAGDYLAAQRLAHSLKGAARSLAMPDLAERLEALEAVARAADRAALPVVLDAVLGELQRIGAAIAAAFPDAPDAGAGG